ncbi:hypothetical protein GCM10010124_26510 [Pilimelia terevasa]|uniref:Uncharacterized protein n=1 Tax=Pilimelia terevasa TaxID=53372 RepID=A0A8J3BQZ5_9ACTN|nr:DUF6284 family protein [Pilimelia terevasa]GGK32429.1 hypothetical protein GCM10010124_26510 [Pilimelia terevasa]
MNTNQSTGRRRLALVAPLDPVPVEGPTTAELEEIEAEWPLIAAELEVVDAECAMARTGSPSELDHRRLRRARDRVLREAAALSTGRRVVTSWAA